MSPSAQHILAVQSRLSRAGLFNGSSVEVTLKSKNIASLRQPIQSEAPLSHAPVVGGILPIGQESTIAVEIFSIEAEINVFTDLVAIAYGGEITKKCATP